MVLAPTLSYAVVDYSSAEYKFGEKVGYVVGGILLFLIVKKLLGK